jgi:hypothetical protein
MTVTSKAAACKQDGRKMTQFLRITDVVHDSRPVLKGEWMSRPVSIELDSSALMKLQGNDLFERKNAATIGSDERIARAAQRLLEDGIFAEQAGSVVLTLTGLDID